MNLIQDKLGIVHNLFIKKHDTYLPIAELLFSLECCLLLFALPLQKSIQDYKCHNCISFFYEILT